MTNYTKSCIYKIACKDPAINDIYIGSTCNFIKRRYNHKTCCNNPNVKEYNYYVYRFIRNNGGWGNWNLYIIEKFSCNTKMQKEQVERGYIEQLKPTLNKCIPANYQTGDTWDEKEYRKGYLEQNKQATDKKVKEYRESHKDEINAYQQKAIHCPCCDHMINLASRARHNKSKRHISKSSTSSSSTSSESEPDTVMDEMTKMRDDNELKLQEMNNICDNINKLIN